MRNAALFQQITGLLNCFGAGRGKFFLLFQLSAFGRKVIERRLLLRRELLESIKFALKGTGEGFTGCAQQFLDGLFLTKTFISVHQPEQLLHLIPVQPEGESGSFQLGKGCTQAVAFPHHKLFCCFHLTAGMLQFQIGRIQIPLVAVQQIQSGFVLLQKICGTAQPLCILCQQG